MQMENPKFIDLSVLSPPPLFPLCLQLEDGTLLSLFYYCDIAVNHQMQELNTLMRINPDNLDRRYEEKKNLRLVGSACLQIMHDYDVTSALHVH